MLLHPKYWPGYLTLFNRILLRLRNYVLSHLPHQTHDCIFSDTACSTLLLSSKQAEEAGCTESERERQRFCQDCIYVLLIKCLHFRSAFMRSGLPLMLPPASSPTQQKEGDGPLWVYRLLEIFILLF